MGSPVWLIADKSERTRLPQMFAFLQALYIERL
jgi:hypothetical protein